MTGLLLVLFGSFAVESGASIGKDQVKKGGESVYMMGFLDASWGTLLYLFLLWSGSELWQFSWNLWPTFAIRSVLEVLQAHMTVIAISKADRSTFGFIRIGTIPLLLLVDIVLGYTLTSMQILGMGLIVCSLVFLMIRRSMNMSGIWYVLVATVNAVATLSLFKYDLEHGNSLVAEQVPVLLLLLCYFFVMARVRAGENILRRMWQPILLLQSLCTGIGTVTISYGYVLLPASIATTAVRSGGLLWSILSGNLLFQERSFRMKVLAAALCILGLVFLAPGFVRLR